MKKFKFVRIIIAFILTILVIMLFLSIASTEAKQDYFEGKVLENTDDYITVKVDSSYENLISKLGETVKIEKKMLCRNVISLNFYLMKVYVYYIAG